jgi:mycoredoxin
VSDDNDQRVPAITVYWRPGCGFCSMLRRDLHDAGVAFEEVNIWDSPDGAAFVRSVARGYETVPTVTVGTTAMVNPSIAEVLSVASDLEATAT